MKSLFAICFVSLLVGTATVSAAQDRRGNEGIRNPLIGTWRLVSLEQPGPNGRLHKIDCSGLLVFTRDGHMSVQVMDRKPHTQTPAGPQQYSQGGYEAEWGTYKIDERAHIFTFHVEGALVRSLIGKDLPRRCQFSGKQLIVTSTRPDEHFRVAWERY